MSGPQFSVEGVLDALAMQRPRREGAGRAIMFVAARGLEGTTTAARAAALAAGPGAVYAIDLDIRRNALAKALSEDWRAGSADRRRASGERFYTVRDLPDSPPAFFYHRVGRTRVYAGVFDVRCPKVRASHFGQARLLGCRACRRRIRRRRCAGAGSQLDCATGCAAHGWRRACRRLWRGAAPAAIEAK